MDVPLPLRHLLGELLLERRDVLAAQLVEDVGEQLLETCRIHKSSGDWRGVLGRHPQTISVRPAGPTSHSLLVSAAPEMTYVLAAMEAWTVNPGQGGGGREFDCQSYVRGGG